MELVRSLGIRAKIILPLAGVAILVAIVGFALIQCAETRQLDRHMTDRSAAIAHAIANVAETVNDSADLQRIVTVMSAEPGVELIVVVAGDPMTVVAASRADWIGLNVFELPGAHRTQVELDRALAANRPCLDLHHDDLDTIAYTLALQTRLRQNHVLHSAPGAVMLHLDARAIQREQRAESTLLVLALLWTIFVAGLVAYVLLKIVVLRPVEAISRVALSTVIGGTGARVNSRRSDELGQLANRFDIMLDELNRRERQQQDSWKQALEAKHETEEALAQLQNHKQALDEHAIVAITNRVGVITYVNDKFCEIAKYSRVESIGQTHRLINSGYHPKSFWAEMWRHIGGGEVWRNEVCNRAKDGSIYWVDTTIVPLKDATGRITQYAAIRTDITQRKAVEAALRESKEQFELAVRGSNDGIWDWNIQTGEVFYSRRYNELIGYEEGELASRFDSFQSHLHPDDIQETLNALQNHLDQNAPYDTVFRLRTKTSNWRWFRARGEAVRTEDGKARRMAGSISDITSLKEVEQELTRAALVDKLTGLPNRGLLQDRVHQAMKRAKRSGRHHYAVMFLDFDRFKIINDSLGHDVGDALLRNIADRLRKHIRGVDSVCLEAIGHTTARLGGDEFVVLLDEMSGADDVKLVADRLLYALSQPYQLGNHEVHSTASIGIVVGDASYDRAEDVLRDADTAMYEAKRRGKGCYVIFDASMRERVQRRMLLENDLRKAIAEQQLFLAYQPIVSLSSGRLVSVEALVRWRHPVEGFVSPSEFIPIAEESDLILTLGQWVLREGCRQLAEWQAVLGSQAPAILSMNLSRRQFARPNLGESIRQIIAEAGVEPSSIQLEVTEDAFVSDVNAAVESMKVLKSLGLKLAIDHFGTGSSSFASLHRFPVDVLKVDRSLLTNIEESKDSASLIHGLAVMVRNLGITMVAEGIEQIGQVIALQELGCDFGQGFLFGKPMSAAQLQDFINRGGCGKLNTQGAMPYATQWADRLPSMEDIASNPAAEQM